MLDSSSNTPQFGTAEYPGAAPGDRCRICGQPIAGSYYRVADAMACPSCADAARNRQAPDSHAAFVRAVLFGAGAALLGMILYAAFEIITGIIIGFASLAVGWMVAAAMMKGSAGAGGRRYQIAAVLLTYAAVSTAAVPVYLSFAIKQHKQKPAIAAESHGDSASTSSTTNPAPDSVEPSTPKSAQPSPAAKPRTGFFRAIGMLVLVGLASPFLELADLYHGVIGLIILFVGLQIAWKIARGKPAAQISGPY